MDMAIIQVDRDPVGWTDRARAYHVLVDGAERAEVRNGATTTVEVPAGPHTVQMKLDWTRSPEVQVEPSPGETVRLRCRPRANPITAVYYTIFARNRYLDLQRA